MCEKGGNWATLPSLFTGHLELHGNHKTNKSGLLSFPNLTVAATTFHWIPWVTSFKNAINCLRNMRLDREGWIRECVLNEEMRGIAVSWRTVERCAWKEVRERERERGGSSHMLEGGGEAGLPVSGRRHGNASLPPSIPPSTTTHMTAAALFCNSSHEDRVVLQ